LGFYTENPEMPRYANVTENSNLMHSRVIERSSELEGLMDMDEESRNMLEGDSLLRHLIHRKELFIE
jgi:hypothetical protein